jgi:hypothetical protein
MELKTAALIVLIITVLTATAIAVAAQNPPGTHTISISFQYDFGKMPACSAQIKKSCVAKFNVYDITAGLAKRTLLVSIPPPADAKAALTPIRGTTPPKSFDSGKHLLAVAAETSEHVESDLNQCTVSVQIP